MARRKMSGSHLRRFGKDRARGYKEGEVDDTPLDKEARQPGVNDPKLWMARLPRLSTGRTGLFTIASRRLWSVGSRQLH